MVKKTAGLLVMAYGTPYREDDIERYYTHIRHGRKPPQEQIEDLKARYRAIGGLSPLAKITEEQAKRLEERLNEVQDEVEFRMYLGLKHIEPFIEDAVERMHDDGIQEAVGIVLALIIPHSAFARTMSGRKRQQKSSADRPFTRLINGMKSRSFCNIGQNKCGRFCRHAGT
ncbi:Ferrochelatase 1 [Geobacillus sp. BCO2]|nr:Ferrochelatase 1 [Geobacillus sp. BCO2]